MPLFWRHGYEGTSLAMLTSELGCAAPTIYAAFGSKEGLYREVLGHYCLRETARHDRQAGKPSPYRQVEAYLRTVAVQFTDPAHPKGCMLGSGLLQAAPGNEAIANFASAARTEGYQSLIASLEDARQAGKLADDTDVEAVARFYVAVVQGMSVQAIDGASQGQLEALAAIALAAWPGDRI